MWIAAALVLAVAMVAGGVLWSQRSAAGSTPLAGTPQLLIIQLPTPTATHPALGAERTRVPLATPTPTTTPEYTATSVPARPQVARVIPTRSGPALTPTPTQASRWTAPAAPPRTSPKGRIAFKSDRSGRTGLYLMNPDGTEVVRLSDDTIYNRARDLETLSPDGLLRLRVLDNNGSYDVYVGPADEQRPPTFITSNAAQDYDPVWSPAGNQIAFVSLRQGRDDIFVMSPDGRDDRPLTHNDALDKHPSWSPDAGQIAFGSDRDGRRQIYIMNADGTNQINISGNDWNDWDPIWLKR